MNINSITLIILSASVLLLQTIGTVTLVKLYMRGQGPTKWERQYCIDYGADIAFYFQKAHRYHKRAEMLGIGLGPYTLVSFAAMVILCEDLESFGNINLLPIVSWLINVVVLFYYLLMAKNPLIKHL